MLVCKYDLEFLSEILSERIRNRVLPPEPPLRGICCQIINAKAGFFGQNPFSHYIRYEYKLRKRGGNTRTAVICLT